MEDLAGTEDGEHVFVGGSSRMAAAFDAVDTVRSVLSILEQQLVVVELIEEVLDSGLSVAIGVEHGFEPLASCAWWWRRSPSKVRTTPAPSGCSARRG